jgi:glycerophosphoryl diester phosphodiesterase
VPRRRPWLYGHRGASVDAPENTIAAFRIALEQGADGIELDVRATADGVPVVLHDSTLDRTTDRMGRIHELTLMEIEGADASAGWLATDAGSVHWSAGDVRVPSFASVMRWLPPDRAIAVEVKDASAVAAVIAILDASGHASDLVLVMSFLPEAIAEARRLAPAIPTGLLIGEGDSLEAGIHLAVAGGHGAIIPYEADLGADPGPSVAATGAAGLLLGCYVVNDRERAVQLRMAGVAFMMSDVPGLLRGA